MNNNSNQLPPEYLMVKQQAKNDLISFQIATNDKYDANWHHDLVARELQHIEAFGDRDYKILIIDEPPRHGKSQQISIDYPAWYLGRNPDAEIITSSYSGDLAVDFGTKTREKVSSDIYNFIFPGVRLKADEKSKGKWRIEQKVGDKWEAGGSYTSVGVGGPITGRGARVFIIDDPLKNREEAESEVVRKKLWQWFTSTAFTRLEPNGVMVVMHTRWHNGDLVGMIKSHPEFANRVKHIHLPAIATQNDAYRMVGDPLWPSRFNIEKLEEIKTLVGPYDWSSLYQGSPVLNEHQEFKPEWFQDIDAVRLLSMNMRKFLTVDTAMSKKSTADYTGFVHNEVNQENFWHIKAWQSKIGPEELIDALFSLHAQNQYEAIGIEKTTYTEGLKPYLDAEQRKRNKFLPIVELSHRQTAKEIRIRGLIPRYAARSIFHVKGQCNDLIEQMMNFPVGTHDDVLDSLAYQLQITDTTGPSMGNVQVTLHDYSID